MARQLPLFPKPPAPRLKRAHLIDAGTGDHGGMVALFRCARCGWESDWRAISNTTEGKRGMACEPCNPQPEAEC